MPKSKAYRFLGLLALFLVQSSMLLVAGGRSFLVPQLVLLFIIIFALSHSFDATLWQSFVAGLLLELFSGWFFGSYIFGLITCGLVIYLITRNLTPQEISIPLTVALVALATVLLPAAAYLYNVFFSLIGLADLPRFLSFFSFSLLWTAGVNFLFFYPLMFAGRFFGRLLLPPINDARSV